ncbi:methylamine utilization protein [soil metagenome]
MPRLITRLALVAATLLSAWPAFAVAGDLVVVARTAKGAPMVDAVVMVQPSQSRDMPAKFAQPLRMSQHDLKFDPFVLAVPVGAEMAFPNEDKVRHQVFSFSAVKRFELRLYGKDQPRVVVFDKPGVVAVGCNIHDSMAGFIKVVDAPYAVKTDASGRAVFRDLPAGAAVVRLWHPYLKAPQGEIRDAATIPASGSVERQMSGDLRPAPAAAPAF